MSDDSKAEQSANPYQMGDWVNLSPFGNIEHRSSMVKRSEISVVVRLRPDPTTAAHVPTNRHGVAIRADGAEQVVRFEGANASEQADLLMEACLHEPPLPTEMGLSKETVRELVAIICDTHYALQPLTKAELEMFCKKALGWLHGGGALPSMRWHLENRATPYARDIADRHYNRQKIGADQFVPPGRCLVLAIPGAALWVTSYPLPEYVKHAWGGGLGCAPPSATSAPISTDRATSCARRSPRRAGAGPACPTLGWSPSWTSGRCAASATPVGASRRRASRCCASTTSRPESSCRFGP